MAAPSLPGFWGRGRESRAAVSGVWAVTRIVLVAGSLKVGPFAAPGGLDYSVTEVYQPWFELLRTGTFPLHDVTWQYPPGAAGPLLLPALLPFIDYGHAFILMCALCDALVALLLLRAGRPRAGGATTGGATTGGARRDLAGCWMWTLGLPLLWTTPWNRFDVMVTALAVAALVAASWRGTGRWRPGLWSDAAFGVLVGLGTLVKVWPVLLLAGTARGRRGLVARVAAGATVLLGAGLFLVTMPGALSFLTAQKDRGIEYEALPALPFQLIRHFGWTGHVGVRDGSTEFLGPGVGSVALLSELLTVAALGWLLWWARRSDRSAETVLPDAAFTAVLLFVATSRVLSPQYLIWLVGLAAVCLFRPTTSQRMPALLVLLACPLTMVVFPFTGHVLIHGSVPAALVLTLRDLLIGAAALLAARRLWTATRPTTQPETATEPGTARPAALDTIA